MKLVIDIPDRIHYAIELGITVNGSDASQMLIDAVKNGVPLPEGCGRLIDADALDVGPVFDENGNRIGYKYVTEGELANAPTVQAIPLSVIDEIKAEIDTLSDNEYFENLWMIDVKDIINRKVKKYTDGRL